MMKSEFNFTLTKICFVYSAAYAICEGGVGNSRDANNVTKVTSDFF
jgi:hypothetical protein